MTWLKGNKVTVGWLFAGVFAFGVLWIVSGDKKPAPVAPKIEASQPIPVKCPPPRVIRRVPQ